MKSWLNKYWPLCWLILVLIIFVILSAYIAQREETTKIKHCDNLLAIVRTAQDSIKVYQAEPDCKARR